MGRGDASGAEGWTETHWGPVLSNETDRSGQGAGAARADLGWMGKTGVQQIGDYKQPPFDESNQEQTIWAARCHRRPPPVPVWPFDTRAVAVFSTVMLWYTKRKADMKKNGVAVRRDGAGAASIRG